MLFCSGKLTVESQACVAGGGKDIGVVPGLAVNWYRRPQLYSCKSAGCV